jgi:benzoylformate decarboxylase
LHALRGNNWLAKREQRLANATACAGAHPIAADWLMMQNATSLSPNVVVVNVGLTSATTLLDMLPYRDRNSYHAFASGGIGWALPAAIGIQLAHPERPVVAVVGDGSSMYSIQALWTAAHLDLPITYVIPNNQGYRILKQRLLAFHGNDHYVGMDLEDPPIDFTGLARSLGMTAHRIEAPDQIRDALTASVDSRRPTLLEVMVERQV